MKNTQKILIAISALVLVGIVVLIIFVKSDDDNTNNDITNPYTLSDEAAENVSDTDSAHSYEEENDATSANKSNETTGTVVSGNSTNSDNPVKNDETYSFSDAEIMQSQKSSFGDIKLLSAKADGKKVFLLEATVKNKKFYYEFPGYYNIENIFYANVDYVYGDEIIIHANTGGNGGAGTYENIILKITSDGIVSLFNSSDEFELLTTFNSNLKENFNVEISNKYTGFKKTINVKGLNDENYADSYWDENGDVMVIATEDEVWVDETYCVFEPKDVDDDGFYEISCSQYTSLGAHSSCIGYAHTTLKYNKDSKQFEITDADFYLPSK